MRRLSCVSVKDSCINAPCSHTCMPLSDSIYQCECPVGYKLEDGDTHNCQNIDECEDESDVCDQECRDTEGSYQCWCRPGYEEINQVECEDIDECTNSGHDCEQVCQNTIGSFVCSCNDTYRLGLDGKHCVDFDECSNSGHDCEQVCLNTIGYFVCSCNDTYRLGPDGKHCVDFNECLSDNDHTCDEPHMVCVNDAGDYHCICSSGFNYDGNRCQDVDECASGDHDCDQLCNNTQGGFICSCEEGYEKTDEACTGQYVIMLYV